MPSYTRREGTLVAAVSLERVPPSGGADDRQHTAVLHGANNEIRWFFREDGPAFEGKLEFRRRIEQLQHATLVFQLCRPVWRRWLCDAVLSGALEMPGFAENPAPYLAVKWIPPKWDWVDPLKDRKAEIEAIAAGLKSRSDVIEGEGFDAEEVDRRIAQDRARERELGLSFGHGSSGGGAAEPEAEERDPETAPATEENAA